MQKTTPEFLSLLVYWVTLILQVNYGGSYDKLEPVSGILLLKEPDTFGLDIICNTFFILI
jgi:hypothetical protein